MSRVCAMKKKERVGLEVELTCLAVLQNSDGLSTLFLCQEFLTKEAVCLLVCVVVRENADMNSKMNSNLNYLKHSVDNLHRTHKRML